METCPSPKVSFPQWQATTPQGRRRGTPWLTASIASDVSTHPSRIALSGIGAGGVPTTPCASRSLLKAASDVGNRSANTLPDTPTGNGPQTPVPIPAPEQTPLYHAFEQARYSRQTQIGVIEERTGHQLICFIGGPQTSISSNDIPPFVDLLHDVQRSEPLDLMLQTPGGDVDQAERIVLMCRRRVGEAQFRVIVPDSAKSAGTLIAVAADEIVMGESSELGPTDPIITITTPGGEVMSRPAQSFLDGLNDIVQQVGTGDLSAAYFPLLDKLDPALIDFCRKALARSEKFALRYLEKHMLKANPAKAKEVAAKLKDVQEFLSHGAVIDADRAVEMGLRINYLDPDDDLWQAYWRLYLEARLALLSPTARLFEGRRASLVF